MFYRFACLVVLGILRLFTRCRVEGLENVPAGGPLLLVCNHLNMVDPPLLGAIFPRRIVFMAKDESFHHAFMGPLVKWYGAFPVRRGQPDRQALRTAESVLRGDGVVGMFPEGHRSKTGKMQRAFPGASLLAIMAAAPVLPVALEGTDQLKSPFALLARPTITVRIGKPFQLQRGEDRQKVDLATLTDHMMVRVAALLPEEYRGYYSNAFQGERK
ncbi:MAG TPA: lysophospholipid acyltransferase family protein [Chloroflexota bacterium]|nr:lysophospholipid acyltransferase family protein [Chloroflexota bacterium]